MVLDCISLYSMYDRIISISTLDAYFKTLKYTRKVLTIIKYGGGHWCKDIYWYKLIHLYIYKHIQYNYFIFRKHQLT